MDLRVKEGIIGGEQYEYEDVFCGKIKHCKYSAMAET